MARERDNVGPEHHVGAKALHLFAEGDGVLAQVAALHALEHHVVAGLQ
jgi:hypothetical protein